MKTIRVTIYKKSKKNDDKQRKPKIEADFAINEIMALTTAQGGGKFPKLYVVNESEPLDLPEQSFVEIKNKLIEASLSEYENVNKFIHVGPRILVNYDHVFQVKKHYGEIVFWDKRTLDDLNEDMLTVFEELSEIEHKKSNERQRIGTRLYLESIAKRQREEVYKHANKFTRLFGTLDDKMVTNGFLVLINIVLSIILIIMIVILLNKL